jgi:hypothetical protein
MFRRFPPEITSRYTKLALQGHYLLKQNILKNVKGRAMVLLCSIVVCWFVTVYSYRLHGSTLKMELLGFSETLS